MERSSARVTPAELRVLVLGLVSLRYASTVFSEKRAWLETESRDARSLYFCVEEQDRLRMLERREVYRSARVLWVPESARWPRLVAAHHRHHLGRRIDAAVHRIARENPGLPLPLPVEYRRPDLDRAALAQLVALVDRVGAEEPGSPALVLARLLDSPIPEPRPVPRTAAMSRLLVHLDHQLDELSRLLTARPEVGLSAGPVTLVVPARKGGDGPARPGYKRRP